MNNAPQIYIVRNAIGQFLGTYFAKNEQQAIQRFFDGERAMSSTFRKSVRMPKYEGLTATRKTL